MARHSTTALAFTALVMMGYGAGFAAAQETDPAAASSNSLTPLLIMTIGVIVLTIAFMVLARVLSGRKRGADDGVVKAPSDEAANEEGSPAQAAAAFAAFEKAKLVGKKAQHAAAEKDVKAGEPLSDEHPS